MNRNFKDAFDQVQASEALKEKTKTFVADKIKNDTKERERRSRIGYRNLFAAAACAVVVLTGGGWLYFTPTVEISMDINPSIELGVNRFDKVVSLKGYGEDGENLAKELDVKYANYEEAVSQVMEHEKITALLSDDGLMEITVVSDKNKQSAEILDGVERCTANQKNTYCTSARPKEVEKAHDAGMSYGKYRAFLQLQALDPEVTAEEVKGMTMREIRTLLLQLSGDDGGNSEGGGGFGMQNGSGGNGQGAGDGTGQGKGAGSGNGAGNGAGQGAGQGVGNGAGQGNGQGKRQGSGNEAN